VLLYTVHRLKGLLFIALFVTFLSFCLMKLAPGDPALILLQQRDAAADPVSLQSARQELGLDRPFLVQYVTWLFKALQGDLGGSYYAGLSVSQEILRAFPITLQLTVSAVGSAFLAALLLGSLPDAGKGASPTS